MLFIALHSKEEIKGPLLTFLLENTDRSALLTETHHVPGAGITVSSPSRLELARCRPRRFSPAWLQNAAISWDGPETSLKRCGHSWLVLSAVQKQGEPESQALCEFLGLPRPEFVQRMLSSVISKIIKNLAIFCFFLCPCVHMWRPEGDTGKSSSTWKRSPSEPSACQFDYYGCLVDHGHLLQTPPQC